MNAKRCVYIPHLGRHVRLGRTPGTKRLPKLRLANYLVGANLPTPPATFDYSPAAAESIAQVCDNDRLGDCVIACGAHLEGVWTGNAGGKPIIYSENQIIQQYSAIGGYVPGDPSTDQGCNEQTALNYWMKNGFAGGTKLAGYLSVDPKNPAEYYLALYLFENLIYGIGLPDSWLQNPHPGFVWDADTPDPNNGHCVLGVGRVNGGVKIATWGFTGTLTDAAHAADVDELWVAISTDMINKATQKAPNGLDWATLATDFNAMGGNIPVLPPQPPSPPSPPSPPTPPVPPTPTPVSEVQQIIDQAFANVEARFRRYRRFVAILKELNREIDAALQNSFGMQPVVVPISPSVVTALVQGAFLAFEAAHTGHPALVGITQILEPIVLREILSLLKAKQNTMLDAVPSDLLLATAYIW